MEDLCHNIYPLFASMDVLFTGKEVMGYQLFGSMVV